MSYDNTWSYLELLLNKKDLTSEQMTEMMQALMSGEATQAQTAALLIALRAKGESTQEIAAAASVMRALATGVKVDHPETLIDTCGTGGDGLHTFNISTTVAFVVAAAGGRVAKHGNRSVSSSSGSADVLELAGMNLDLTTDQIAMCISSLGVGFLFAPVHHGAMKHVIGVRRELGVRTIFNLLGPLTNPAGAKQQVIGVFSQKWLEPIAQVLRSLGSTSVWVVHSEDGLDEISISGTTHVAQLSASGQIACFTIHPKDVGYKTSSLKDIQISFNKEDKEKSKIESLNMLNRVLNNEAGAWRDIVCLNAGAALFVGGLADDFVAGVRLAEQVIASRQAKETFERAIALTQQLGKEA